MMLLYTLEDALVRPIARATWLVPSTARFLFAAIFLSYFWTSGLTKLGDGIWGIFQPSTGAYAQIFPRAMRSEERRVGKECRSRWSPYH